VTPTPLEIALAEVDVTMADLELVLPRLTLTASYGERMASGSRTAPVPVNVAALDAKHALLTWLTKAVLRLEAPMVRDGQRIKRTAKGLSSHLFCHLSVIEQNGWADQWARELRGLLNECGNVTHHAQRREFAGTCQTPDCGTELWVTIGGDDTRCRTCDATYTAVQEWRQGARDYAKKTEDDIVGYPATLAQRLATIHGETVGADYIRVLASRGLLTRANPERGADGKKLRAMYRLGDVKQLIGRQAA
jgi:hypothetical protein